MVTAVTGTWDPSALKVLSPMLLQPGRGRTLRPLSLSSYGENGLVKMRDRLSQRLQALCETCRSDFFEPGEEAYVIQFAQDGTKANPSVTSDFLSQFDQPTSIKLQTDEEEASIEILIVASKVTALAGLEDTVFQDEFAAGRIALRRQRTELQKVAKNKDDHFSAWHAQLRLSPALHPAKVYLGDNHVSADQLSKEWIGKGPTFGKGTKEQVTLPFQGAAFRKKQEPARRKKTPSFRQEVDEGNGVMKRYEHICDLIFKEEIGQAGKGHIKDLTNPSKKIQEAVEEAKRSSNCRSYSTARNNSKPVPLLPRFFVVCSACATVGGVCFLIMVMVPASIGGPSQ